jgi:hypothetical protein
MDSVEAGEMTVNVTPLHDRVLVRRLEEKETAKGGIIIPDTAKEKPQEGEVMAVGAGKIEKGHGLFGKGRAGYFSRQTRWAASSLRPGCLL